MGCSTFSCHGSIDLNALEEVFQDPSFNTSSFVAANALKVAIYKAFAVVKGGREQSC